MFNYKQVIIVRKDLNMSPGKLAVQVAHGSVGAIFDMLSRYPEMKLTDPDHLLDWFNEGYPKICLSCKNESELLSLKEKTDAMGYPNHLVTDMGKTELPPNTITCLGIGPLPIDMFKGLTEKLSLYK